MLRSTSRTSPRGLSHPATSISAPGRTGVAICSVLGQQLFTLGLRHIPSALSTLLLQMETVDAFILQIVFVGKVGPMSLVGASLICIWDDRDET